jgi:hypothetical protein
MKTHNLRLTENHFDTIKVLSRHQMRSMNAQIVFMLQEFLDNHKSTVTPKQPHDGTKLDSDLDISDLEFSNDE